MTTIEILLIVLGFIFVGLSFLIGEKAESKKSELDDKLTTPTKALWTEKDEAIVKKQIDQVMQESVEELVDSATEEMNRISNEKIIAVDEFSTQVLDKIEQNHKEVVFMYNMLNEKDKLLKETVSKRQLVSHAEPVKSETVRQVNEPKKVMVNKPSATKTKIDYSGENISNATELVDTNARIQQLHKSGKTILEISKELQMGQGEVKLVIDLYGGR